MFFKKNFRFKKNFLKNGNIKKFCKSVHPLILFSVHPLKSSFCRFFLSHLSLRCPGAYTWAKEQAWAVGLKSKLCF